MIRYFDASAVVKRYVHEQGSASVKRWLKTGAPATCRLTEAEISAALARRVREGDLTIEQRMTALRLLHADLALIHVVELGPTLVKRVLDIVSRHPLRASDALHLAAALFLAEVAGGAELVAYDDRLAEAARAEGLVVLP